MIVDAFDDTGTESAQALLQVAEETSSEDLLETAPHPAVEPEDMSAQASLKSLVNAFVQ